MNINQMGLCYNVHGELVNMKPQERDAVMLNKKALLRPLRRARWLQRQAEARKAA
jgi:hypothetical protein